ncbi:MAG: TetR/AcrR family transcriptional regulator [Thermodesulfobacteriota bacterium]
MAPRKGELTRNHILQTARGVLVTKGFHNTSINDILVATGVKKGNLYYYFSSKEELGLAVLEDAMEEFFTFLNNALHGDDPIAKILNSCDAILQELKKRNFVGGCLFGNTALEMSDSNENFSRVIRQVFSIWTDQLAGLLAEAREEGGLPSAIPDRLLAKTIVATIEGGIMMARVNKDEEDLADCLRALRVMLGR